MRDRAPASCISSLVHRAHSVFQLLSSLVLLGIGSQLRFASAFVSPRYIRSTNLY